jgi:NAD(P)-dependent dehydrogenase (short-subunit alcohol dehydrogenase family)
VAHHSATRVAMISGANRGIGLAIAERLAQDGWTLSLGVRDPAHVLGGILPDGALVCGFDARQPGGELNWVDETVKRFGRVDAIVNNAGIMIPKSVIDADDEDIEALLDVNVKSPLRLARAAWPHLLASGQGRVITIVSLSGKRVKSAAAGAYSVSKFAALALSHALRHAGWDRGVRATALCPGFVATDMARSLTDTDPSLMTQPRDIARIAALILDLPNTASIAEIPVNWQLEESF